MKQLFIFLKQAFIPQSHEDLLHWCSHIGMSFVIQTFGMDLLMHFLHTKNYNWLAFLPTLIIGLGYKLVIENAGTEETMTSMTRNMIGMCSAMLLMIWLG